MYCPEHLLKMERKILFKTIAVGERLNSTLKTTDKWGFIADRQGLDRKLLTGIWLGIKGQTKEI